MTTLKHIIHRINLDIEAAPGIDGHLLQDRVLHILHERILPEIGKEIDALDTGGSHIRVSELNLDLGDMRSENLEDELALKMRQQLMMQVRAFLVQGGNNFRPAPEIHAMEPENEVKAESLTPERQMLDIFMHYLRTGQLPWYCDGIAMLPSGEAITGAMYKLDAGGRALLKNLLAFDGKALARLILQYDRPVANEILAMLLASSAAMRMDGLKAGVASLTKGAGAAGTRQLYIRKIGQLLQASRFGETELEISGTGLPAGGNGLSEDNRSSDDGVTHRTDSYDLHENQQDTASKPGMAELAADFEEPVPEMELPGEGVLVTHAGLVILHPFLEYFFREFGLLEGDRFRDEEGRLTAVQLLAYLATGEDNLYEYDLPLEKFLCDISPYTPVPRKSMLTPAMKTEAGNLLKAAISHWKELKNTSPDGLRQGFLIRRGKLVAGTFGHRLLIEKASQDIMLSWLPWGISLVKLPWLNDVLYVEWN